MVMNMTQKKNKSMIIYGQVMSSDSSSNRTAVISIQMRKISTLKSYGHKLRDISRHPHNAYKIKSIIGKTALNSTGMIS